MNYTDTFTSTGIKLMKHPAVVSSFMDGQPVPITLQLAPTSNCNLNCSFCSNVNRAKNEQLPFENIVNLIDKIYTLKSVEITGGGEPTLYPQINELLKFLNASCLKVGLITNGTNLSAIKESLLNQLAWMRISLNALDYVKEIKIPKFKGTLGFSYVIESEGLSTARRAKEKIDPYVKKYNPAYVRIVPNCQNTIEKQEWANTVLSKKVESWGAPYFYQVKTFSQPKECWWCYFKPFVLHDGWVYPCSSVVLNESADRQFHEKFRWVRMENLMQKYRDTEEIKPLGTLNCSHCVFGGQNSLLSSLRKVTKHDYFL